MDKAFDGIHFAKYASISSTIWKAGPQTLPQKLVMMSKLLMNPRLRKVIKCVKFAKSTIFKNHFQGRFADKEFAEKIFNEHIAKVKAFVPPEKLLIYDVSEGWAPLCEFLRKPLPSTPLPHLNKKENFRVMLGELMKGNMA